MPEIKKNGFCSLRVKTAAVFAAAAAAAVVTYTVIMTVGFALADGVYMSDEKCAERSRRYFSEFETYVRSNNIAASDAESVKQWCADKKYVYVSVYRGNRLFYETDGSFIKAGGEAAFAENYPAVEFSDGMYEVSIIEFSEERVYGAVRWVSLIASAAVMLRVMLGFIGNIIKRFKTLCDEIELVNGGELNREICAEGNDEIARLAQSAEKMRRSIIGYYENEQRAYRSNAELVTAISHDIRTPLTSLILYSEALADGKVTDGELMKKYAKVCLNKSRQLKELTDTMFKYFLAFGKSEGDFDIEHYNASELITQLLGEHTFALAEKGFQINTVSINEECVISTDASVLKRVFDNVFSNLEKYADKERPISVSLGMAEESLRISVINYIAVKKEVKESTNIGLKSCERIMELVGGSFDYWKSPGVFEALITLPTVKEN